MQANRVTTENTAIKRKAKSILKKRECNLELVLQ